MAEPYDFLSNKETRALENRWASIVTGMCPHSPKHETARGCLQAEVRIIRDRRLFWRMIYKEVKGE